MSDEMMSIISSGAPSILPKVFFLRIFPDAAEQQNVVAAQTGLRRSAQNLAVRTSKDNSDVHPQSCFVQRRRRSPDAGDAGHRFRAEFAAPEG
ncbi:hypothetical protein [Bradyrhizobium sp. ARR65]|uniref:hypothetical protein n=1 Tax=Bradyrhizobium sp. ARR65 TaxID=1040989 RepID=UPI0018DB0305|nr:hypothetical protein [Bradyrhizobium sp. ARR65]